MIKCANCGSSNPEGIDLCLSCAAALTLLCPSCGKPAPAGNRFCGHCGARLAAPEAELPASPPPVVPNITEVSGERREVSVLFVDVSNFTSVAHVLDSEEVFVLIDEAMRLLVQVVHKYEGTIDKFTGDGLMALFGVPLAHENDPERAVRSALEMQSALRPLAVRIRERHGFDFLVRVGVNTGTVIAGRLGSDLHSEYTVIGDTVNLASRLQSAAEPGTVLVSQSTQQRCAAIIDFEPVAGLALKGMPEPVTGYRATGLRSRPGNVRGLPGMQVPMVGRESALRQLQQALASVRITNQSQVALVTGVAGVGKSRLALELRRALAHHETSIFQGSCLSYARSMSYWVVAELLRDLMQCGPAAGAEAQRAALQAYVERQALSMHQAYPYLLNVLGLAGLDPTVEARLRLLDPAMLQRQTHGALHQALRAATRRAAVVLIFDDLHWVDPASRDFLEYLIQSAADMPVLLLLISREMERETVIRPLVDAAQQDPGRLFDIRLHALNDEECQRLVGELLARTAGDETGNLHREIAARAEGNPFYAEELVRLLIDRGGLARGEDGAGWTISEHARALLSEVPGTVEGLILAPFDRLPAELRHTLHVAALLGSPFPLDVLATLSGTPRPALQTQMDELVRRQFVVAIGASATPAYAFRHALIQEAVYRSLLKQQRQRLHGKAAELIQRSEFWLPEDRTKIVAYHYAESTQPTRAIPFLLAAAQNAARHCANETAIQDYRRALALLPEAKDHAPADWLAARVGLGRCLKFTGGFAEAEAALQEALAAMSGDDGVAAGLEQRIDALRELADVRQRTANFDAAVAGLEDGLDLLRQTNDPAAARLRRQLLDRLAWLRFRQCRLDEAAELAQSAIEDGGGHGGAAGGDATGDPITLASLYNTLGGLAWQQGELDRAVSYVERSLALYGGVGYLWGMAIAYTNLGVLHYSRGQWPQALENLERAYALRRDNGYLPEQATNLKNLGLLRLAMGDHDRAQIDLERCLAISQRLGDDYGQVLGQIGLAHVALVRQRYDEAAEHLDLARERLAPAWEDEAIELQWLSAVVSGAAGQVGTGLASITDALAQARAAGLAEHEADCLRVRGTLLGLSGDVAEAETQLRAAIDLCRAQNDLYRLGQAQLELGRLYARSAANDDELTWAAGAFEEAARNFEAVGAAHFLQLARQASAGLLASSIAGGDVEPQPVRTRHAAAVVWLDFDLPHAADDEERYALVTRARTALASLVRDLDGHAAWRPDGLTVAFGAPMAHEDDAGRAVQMAWQATSTLLRLAAAAGLMIQVQVGIASGHVVAAALPEALAGVRGTAAGHAAASTAYNIAGQPVESARRLAGEAAPGEIHATRAISHATARLAHYEMLTSDSALLIGLAEPTAAEPPAAHALIGRQTQIEQILQLAGRLSHGTGGLVWLEGEAGIGKSRLMQEVAAVLAGESCRVARARALPRRADQAYALFTALLENLAPQPAALAELACPEAQPYLKLLLGEALDGDERELISRLEPNQLRQQIFVALRTLLRKMAASQPLVLLLDDLDWIDSFSADLLLFLANLVAVAPVLFMCSRRGTHAGAAGDRLQRIQELYEEQTLRLSLPPLSPDDSVTLLHELLPARADSATEALILKRSEGNPYFIEEFARTLLDRKNRAVAGRHADEDLLPLSIEGLIRARVDGLAADLRRVLQCASVLGSPFEPKMLQALCDRSNARALLAELADRGLLREADDGEGWQFTHSLVEAAVYESLLHGQRRAIHLKAAQALETGWAGTAGRHPDTLAYHLLRAEEPGRALPYMVLAGERAAACGAHAEALKHFSQAASLDLPGQPDSHVRWRIIAGLGDAHQALGQCAEAATILNQGLELPGLADYQRAGLYRRLGETARRQGDLEGALDQFSAALEELKQPARRDAQTEMGRIYLGVARARLQRGHIDAARQAAQTAERHARAAHSLSDVTAAANLMGGIFYRAGDWQLALAHTEKAMALSEEIGYSWGVASTMSNLGVLAVAAGQWERGRAFFERSLALRSEQGDVEGMALVHNNLGTLARDQGQFTPANKHFRAALAIAAPLKLAYHVITATTGLAETLFLQAMPVPAQEILTTSMLAATELGLQDLLIEVYRVQAELYLAAHMFADARRAARHAAALAKTTGNRLLECAAWRLVCECETQNARFDPARAALGRAYQAAAELTDQLESGRLAAQAGRLHLALGNHLEAAQELNQAAAAFAALGAAADQAQVEELLAQLGSLPIQGKPACICKDSVR